MRFTIACLVLLGASLTLVRLFSTQRDLCGSAIDSASQTREALHAFCWLDFSRACFSDRLDFSPACFSDMPALLMALLACRLALLPPPLVPLPVPPPPPPSCALPMSPATATRQLLYLLRRLTAMAASRAHASETLTQPRPPVPLLQLRR